MLTPCFTIAGFTLLGSPARSKTSEWSRWSRGWCRRRSTAWPRKLSRPPESKNSSKISSRKNLRRKYLFLRKHSIFWAFCSAHLRPSPLSAFAKSLACTRWIRFLYTDHELTNNERKGLAREKIRAEIWTREKRKRSLCAMPFKQVAVNTSYISNIFNI